MLGSKQGTGPEANSFLRELFLQRMPPSVTDPATTLENLADMADKVNEVSTPTVAAISTPSVVDSEVKQLRPQITRLTELCPGTAVPTSRNRHPANTPPPTLTTSKYCVTFTRVEHLIH